MTVDADAIRLLLMLANLAAGSNNTSKLYLPTLSLPSSKSSVSVLAPAAENSSSLLLTIVEFNKTLIANAISGTSGGSTNASVSSAVPLVLQSDVLTVKLFYGPKNSNKSTAVLPSFVANLSLTVSPPSVSSITVFSHNCSVGIVEVVTFLCAGSLVRYNLTCSGNSAVHVRRQCPVPQTVCNVLNILTLTVLSTDYCQATQSSAGFVVCSCGLNSTTKATAVAAILASTGSVNVAVMTQYIAGDFGVIGGSGGVSAAAFAQQSSAIFLTFGCLWGVGLVLVFIHYQDARSVMVSRKVKHKKASKSASNLLSVLPEPMTVGDVTTPDAVAPTDDNVAEVLWEYMVSLLPATFRPGVWWMRLWDLLCEHHDYGRALASLVGYKSRDRMQATMEIVRLLTLVMVSFLVLAVLYDFQFPADDGSCELYSDEQSCLTRKSLLDASVTYCTWKTQALAAGNVLMESRNGQVLQKVDLSEVSTEETSCSFNESESSILITVMSIVIASITSIPMELLLSLLFARIGAPSMQPQHTAETARAISSDLHSISNTCREDGRQNLSLWTLFGGYHILPASVTWNTDRTQTHQIIQLSPEVARSRARLMEVIKHCHLPIMSVGTKTSRTPVPSSSTSQMDAGLLTNATDLEFGATLLHTYMREILHSRHSNEAEKLFAYALSESYPLEDPPASNTARYLCMFCLLCINAGSLFYIALKGIQRGYSWQLTFLNACVVEWLTDVLFVSMIEVWFMNIILPSLALQEVAEVRRWVHRRIVQYAQHFVRCSMRESHNVLGQVSGKGHEGAFAYDQSNDSAFDGDRSTIQVIVQNCDLPCTSLGGASSSLIQARPGLIESHFVHFTSLQHATNIELLHHEAECSSSRLRSSWWRRKSMRIVHVILDVVPLEVLQFFVSLSSSLVLGLLLYINFLLSSLSVGALSLLCQIVLTMCLVVLAVYVARLSLHVEDQGETVHLPQVIPIMSLPVEPHDAYDDCTKNLLTEGEEEHKTGKVAVRDDANAVDAVDVVDDDALYTLTENLPLDEEDRRDDAAQGLQLHDDVGVLEDYAGVRSDGSSFVSFTLQSISLGRSSSPASSTASSLASDALASLFDSDSDSGSDTDSDSSLCFSSIDDEPNTGIKVPHRS